MSEESTHALDRARAVRGGHRGVTTKLVRKAEELSLSKSLEPSQRSQLNVIYQQLEGKLNLLSDMDKDILSWCEIEAINTGIEESDAIVAKIINCKQWIKEVTTRVSEAASLVLPPTMSTASPTTAPKLRLPKLVLPKFKGDVKDWTGLFQFLSK